MRLGLISDIHGNLAALEAVLSRLDALGVTDILCLGDVAGYYPDLDACVDMLRQRGIRSLMGNHDDYIARGAPCPRSDSANRCLNHQRSHLRADTLAWLQDCPLRMRHGPIDCVHAGWNDPLDEYMAPSDAYFEGMEADVFASGHTHVQYIWQGRDKVFCNPGSVGQPRDGNPRAAFAVWEDGQFTLYRAPYDIQRTQAAMAQAGFTSYFSENLSAGTRIGGKIDAPPDLGGIETHFES